MSPNRRKFVKDGVTVAAATVIAPRLLNALGRNPASWAEPVSDSLMAAALDAAKAAGATYADVRIGRYRRQNINTRERQIAGVSDGESYGMGIRTIAGGA